MIAFFYYDEKKALTHKREGQLLSIYRDGRNPTLWIFFFLFKPVLPSILGCENWDLGALFCRTDFALTRRVWKLFLLDILNCFYLLLYKGS